MNTKSPEDPDLTFRGFVLLSFIQDINGDFEHVERLHLLSYLLDQQLSNDIWVFQYKQQDGILHSSQIDECLEGLVKRKEATRTTSRTFGGDERVSYEITDKGRTVVTNSKTIGEYERISGYISKTVSEYGSVPISNLVEIANGYSRQATAQSSQRE